MSNEKLRLRVLGSSDSVPRAWRACSCYLLQSPETSIVMDFGTGALPRLRGAIAYPELDAMLISHMHADHFIDLIPMRYGLKYGPEFRAERLPLWLPPDGTAMLRMLCASFASEGPGDFLDDVFDVQEYDPMRPLHIKDLCITFTKTIHYIDCYAMRIECDDAVLTYSGDTAPCDRVIRLAEDSDLFICEATLGLIPEIGMRGHATAAEAAEMAERAGAKHLLLTHYGSRVDPDDMHDVAARVYAGRVTIADDGNEFRV
ncbi:MAG TPA: MBL fold metallo-hydrolase [Candidatus Dormibacteraeota bacterium]|nr:MBL fold metallo-hydrolase [Candidatus Dormibacteraeota bacterium]